MRRALHWLIYTSAGQVTGTLVAAVGSLLLTAAAVEGFSKFVDQSGYHVHVTFADVNTLYDHQTVKLNGVTVGQIDDISPNWRQRGVDVNLGIEPRYAPLHQGAQFSVRSSGLFAEQYVRIVDGPASAPAMTDGASIPLAETVPAVGIDAVVDTLDASTRAEIRTLITQSRTGLSDRSAADLNAGLEALDRTVRALDPAVRTFSQHTSAIESMISDYDQLGSRMASDRAALGQTVPQLEAAFATLDTHRDEISQALRAAATTMTTATTVVTQREPDLRATIVETPAMLRTLDAMLGQFNPLLAKIEPLAPQLRDILVELDRSMEHDAFGDALRVLPQFGAGSFEEAIPGEHLPDPGFPPSGRSPSTSHPAATSAGPATDLGDENSHFWGALFK